jgi:hypothetical protein
MHILPRVSVVFIRDFCLHISCCKEQLITGFDAYTCDVKGVYRPGVSSSEVYYTAVSLSAAARTDVLCKMNATRFETLCRAQIKLSEYLGKDVEPLPRCLAV